MRDLSTDQLCLAAGIADRTYRRPRTAPLASGSVELVNGVGGRGNTNVWMVRNPREFGDAVPSRVPRRVAPPAGARPLIVSARSPGAAAQVRESATRTGGKGGQDRTLTAGNSPILTGFFGSKGGHDLTVPGEKCPVVTGVSVSKGGQDQTLFELAPLESPARTPAETPASNARAGREPLNPRIREDPPAPLKGEPAGRDLVEETYATPHGRKRRRSIRVDLDEVRRHLGILGLVDRDDWEQVRDHLCELVGDSTFEIWLQPLELIAVDPVGTLVIAAPAATRGWVEQRFSRVLARAASSIHARCASRMSPSGRRSAGKSVRGPQLSAQFTSTKRRSRDGHSGRKPEGWRRKDNDGSEHRRAVRTTRSCEESTALTSSPPPASSQA